MHCSSVSRYCERPICYRCAAGITLLRADTLELATRALRYDLILHLRTAGGYEFLLMVEWQGSTNTELLWRTMRYLAELAEQRPIRPVLGVVIYLEPDDDVGDRLAQELEGVRGAWSFQIDTIRLWELEAAAYVTAGPGLAVLSPLMRGASIDTVFAVAERVIDEAGIEEQSELLNMLSVFSERFIDPTQFIALVGKERLMRSGVFNILAEEVAAERVAAREVELRREADLARRETAERVAAREAELCREADLARREAAERVAAREAELRREAEQARHEAAEQAEQAKHEAAEQARREVAELAEQAKHEAAELAERVAVDQARRAVTTALVIRFPNIPFPIGQRLSAIHDVAALERLLESVLIAPDQDAVAAAIIAASTPPAA